MTWMASLARVFGAAVPFGSILVQISAEVESRDIQARLRRLEDPISSLHPDIRELASLIYTSVEDSDESRVQLSQEEYERFRRPLAMLEQNGHIRGSHSLQQRFIAGFWLVEPTFVLYMCALFEDPDIMERLVAYFEATKPNSWMHGKDIAGEFAVPLPVVKALFQLYEARGLGMLSKELGAVNFYLRD